MTTPFQKLLQEFGNTLGLEQLTLDASGYCCLHFDQVIVNLEVLDDSHALLLVYSPIGKMRDPNDLALVQELLKANHFFAATAGATLGLGEDLRTISLSKLVETASLDITLLERLLNAFVAVAEYWSKRVQAHSSAPSTTPSSTAMPLMPVEIHHMLRV